MNSWPEFWSWLNSNAGGVSALGVLVTAAIAMTTLIHAARDSTRRTRPYVAAELVPAEHSTSSTLLVVKNYGLSAARDLSVSFDPEFAEEDVERTMAPRLIVGRYANPVRHLSPGQALTNTWVTYVAGGGGSELVPQWDAPDPCTVTVRYRKGRWRWYHEQFVLDEDVVKNTSVVVSSDSELGTRRKLIGAMRAIAEPLKRIAGALPDPDRVELRAADQVRDRPPAPSVDP